MAFFPFWVPEGLEVSQFATLIFPRPVSKSAADPANPGANKQGEIMVFFPFWVPEGLGVSQFCDPVFPSPDDM